MKCPLCKGELDIYDIDFHFDGNEDKYCECMKCGTGFTYYYRYHHLWKYDIIHTNSEKIETIYVYRRNKNA